MELSTFTNYESQVRSYCRSFSAIFTRAKGSLLFDQQGDSYIDFLCGAGSLNFGHNPEKIKTAVIEYLANDGIVHGLDLHTSAKEQFLSTLQDVLFKPRGLDFRVQFTGPTGTSSVESAVKLARKVTGRQNIVCFTNAFHGMTSTSLSLTGSQHHRQSFTPQSGILRFPFDGYINGMSATDSISYFRKLFTDPSSGTDLPAAILLEVVQGEGGVNIASNAWLQGLRELTKELGILLIIDDIQAGVGRCGQFFSFEASGIKPDMVCLSKSIGGMGLPFALLLMSDELDVWSPGEDNGTFRGNNLAFVAATKMLELYWKNDVLEREIALKESIVQEMLGMLLRQYPETIKEIRGRGLMYGVEFHNPTVAKQVASGCFDESLIIECCGPKGEVVKLMPALTIPIEELQKGLNIITSVIKRIA